MAEILIPNFSLLRKFSDLRVDSLLTDPTYLDLYKLFLSDEVFQTISTERNNF